MDKISYRVMKMQEFGGKSPSVFYKVDCSCGDNDHNLIFEIEHNMNELCLNLYQNIAWSSYYGSENVFRRIKDRIVNSFKVLVFGYLEGQTSFSLNGEEHIQNFINALEEGKGYVKNFEEEFQKERDSNKVSDEICEG